jgi:hypothetical protein
MRRHQVNDLGRLGTTFQSICCMREQLLLALRDLVRVQFELVAQLCHIERARGSDEVRQQTGPMPQLCCACLVRQRTDGRPDSTKNERMKQTHMNIEMPSPSPEPMPPVPMPPSPMPPPQQAPFPSPPPAPLPTPLPMKV